jgi:hypothetical protein
MPLKVFVPRAPGSPVTVPLEVASRNTPLSWNRHVAGPSWNLSFSAKWRRGPKPVQVKLTVAVPSGAHTTSVPSALGVQMVNGMLPLAEIRVRSLDVNWIASPHNSPNVSEMKTKELSSAVV